MNAKRVCIDTYISISIFICSYLQHLSHKEHREKGVNKSHLKKELD